MNSEELSFLTIPSLRSLDTADALTLITAFNAATDERSIVALLRSLSQLMGVDHFRLVLILPSSIQRPEVRMLHGCPTEWVKNYNNQGFFGVDPVVRKGMNQSAPILWAHLIEECCEQKNMAGLDVMLQAQAAGLRDGLTIPWHGADGHVGLLSFITSEPRREYQWLTALPFLSWLSIYIFEAVARVYLAEAIPRDALSSRELEVCQWAAEGKQVSDIAKILDITPRTVTFHLGRVVGKLGASSKSQAISWALKQGLVRFNLDSAQVTHVAEGGN